MTSYALKKRTISLLTTALLLTGSVVPSFAVPLQAVKPGFAKNVIIMIPDGMSHSGVTLTRWVYNDGRALNMDALASGLISTHNADTAIADSAPAGTAMATGYKTQDKLVGVKPDKATLIGAKAVTPEEAFAPTASILEAAKLSGKAVGIVATSEIQHATPADFSSHAVHRGLYTTISEQQVYQQLDVVLGGGADYLLPDPKKSTDPKSKMRIDGENMVTTLKSLGYHYVTNRADMQNVKSGKLWGAFASGAMNKNLVKTSEEPSLSEMTQKSIDLLSKNKQGFFLMVEGSQVDWAAHGNQTVGLISEIKAFDDAVGVALKYAKSNKDTLVIVASDHGNGGISIGDSSTSSTYPEHPMSHFTQTLKQAKITEEKAAGLVNETRSNIKSVMAQLGIQDLSSDEEALIANAKGVKDGKAYDNTAAEMVKIINKRAHIGWTTGGHTGEDVVLYVYAADYGNQLSGTIQNTDIANYSAKALGLDLAAASSKLFVPMAQLEKRGYVVRIDASDATNVVLVLSKAGKTFRVPENKNYFEVGGKKVSYNGINVYNGKSFFVPEAALTLMK